MNVVVYSKCSSLCCVTQYASPCRSRPFVFISNIFFVHLTLSHCPTSTSIKRCPWISSNICSFLQIFATKIHVVFINSCRVTLIELKFRHLCLFTNQPWKKKTTLLNRLGYSCSCKMSTFFLDVASLFTYASPRQQSRKYRFPKSDKCLYLEYFYKCHASVTANKHSVIDALKLPVHFPGRSSCSCPLFYSLYSETADVTLAGNFQSAFSVVGNDKTRTTVGLLGAWDENAAPHAPWFSP